MLYKKKSEKELSRELFENPTSEYRGTPLWSWNTDLKKEELLWQIERLKEMGFGGYHMHVRAGMSTEYLSDEFMDLIKSCVEKGKEESMLSWLYDEDRWPSGYGGGYVTKNPEFRQKYLALTAMPIQDAVEKEEGIRTARPYLLAAFDVKLNENGELADYKKTEISALKKDGFLRRYFYVCVAPCSGAYNGYTYVDTLNERALQKFVDIVYERFYNAVGEDFDKAIPSIFSDEPHHFEKKPLPNAWSEVTATMPWTSDLNETFVAKYGYSLIEKLPELFWDNQKKTPSQSRYHFHDHVTERFVQAFANTCGKWCERRNIRYTGHVYAEPSLAYQTANVGEVMRFYPVFGIPGMDLLSDALELTTAKQVQSIVRQYAKEGMLSELYGVTGWDFDFRGHKIQGDWQAACGVTVRAPHLSWVSMRGMAKRDYPASIHYQSSWYGQYSFVENHFARLNTALTRGTPVVNVAILHPIESTWLAFGPADTSLPFLNAQDAWFAECIDWFTRGTVDFDLLSESILKEKYSQTQTPKLKVGAMQYQIVFVPPVQTLRSTTIEILNAFLDCGGKVIFAGDCPQCVDGTPSTRAKELYERSEKCVFEEWSVLRAVESARDVSLKNADGGNTGNLLYTMRQDGQSRWLFIAHINRVDKKRLLNVKDWEADDSFRFAPQTVSVCVKGTFKPTLYDTVSGKISPLGYCTKNGETTFSYVFYAHDSLLVKLAPTTENERVELPKKTKKALIKRLELIEDVEYVLHEPNVMVLDLASLSWDKKEWLPQEQITRTDVNLRKEFSWPLANGSDYQPWAIPEITVNEYPYLRFTFESEIEAENCLLAHESATEIYVNGESVAVNNDGYFVDKDIIATKIPKLKKGKNEIIVRMPISKRITLENCFLLGEFGVRVNGSRATVVPRAKTLSFSSLIGQGMPFYGGAISYKVRLDTPNCDLRIQTSQYKGAVIAVKLDGVEIEKIAYAPYTLEIDGVQNGEHVLEFVLYCTRINCFGALHNARPDCPYKGPNMYFTENEEWSYEYVLQPTGIEKSPVIEILKRE